MRALVATALLATLGTLPMLTGCDGAPQAVPTTRAAAPTPTNTPLSAYASLSDITVSRSLFCDRVSPTAIEHAIGGPPASSDSWVNGDRTPTGQTGREYGCAWSAPTGQASAWVFAPPITRARAKELAAMAPRPHCRRLPAAQVPPFGDPSAAYGCPTGARAKVVRLSGLFGDAWLTCEVRVDPTADDPADEFCGAILAAASTPVA